MNAPPRTAVVEEPQGGPRLPVGRILVLLLAATIFALILVAFSAFAYRSSRFGSFVGVPQKGDLQSSASTVIEGVFGTIQFSVAVLSGVIIVFAAIVSFVVGRSARQSQESAQKELSNFAALYQDNLERVRDSLILDVRNAVDAYLSQESTEKLLADYKRKLEELTRDASAIQPLVDSYKQFQEATKELETDYLGPFLSVRALMQQGNESNTESMENRKLAQTALLALQEGALARRVAAQHAFNGAQTAAEFEFSDLAHRLAVLANWLQRSPDYQARVYRSEFERGDRYRVDNTLEDGQFQLVSDNPGNEEVKCEQIRQEAYRKILNSVYDIPLQHCELIYAEIWNVCERAGRLYEFIAQMEDAVQKGEASGQYMPSICHAMISRAAARVGAADWRTTAESHLFRAIEKAGDESPVATWYTVTLESIARMSKVLRLDSGETDADEENAAEDEVALDQGVEEDFSAPEDLPPPSDEPSPS